MRLNSAFLLFTAGLACGPDKTDSEATGDASTSAAASTSGETTTPPTGGPGASSETSATGSTGETGETTGPDECAALAEQALCEADPDCMAIVGQVGQFPKCGQDSGFIACIAAMPCDSVILDICQDGGDKLYTIPSGCVPPGYSLCPRGDLTYCQEPPCEGLDEENCAMFSCTQITGAPHMQMNGETCIDMGTQEFLGCRGGDVACPPTVVSVCPEGQPDIVFDVASGCIPPGFIACDMTVPECP